MACTPSEDSDQPGHPPSLIRVFAVHMKKAWVLSYPLSAQRRLWSDWADAQADLSLRWAQISLGIRPVWSESSLSVWRKLGSLATHWAPSEDSDQTGRMPRLIWVFAGHIATLLVFSWGGTFSYFWINFISVTQIKISWRHIIGHNTKMPHLYFHNFSGETKN